MPATALTQPEAQQQDQALRTDFSTPCAELQRDVDAFKAKVQRKAEAREEIRPGLVAEAADLVAAGEAICAAFEKSPWPERIRTANWLHKALTAGRNLVFAPIVEAEGIHSRLSLNFKLQEQRKAEQERQRQEALQRQEQENQRKAKVATLIEDDRIEEAGVLERQPLPPVMAPPPKPAAPIPGVKSIATKAKFRRVTDSVALLGFFVKNPALFLELMGAIQGAWDRLLTAHLDRRTGEISIDIPGIEWELDGTVRKARNGNDQA